MSQFALLMFRPLQVIKPISQATAVWCIQGRSSLPRRLLVDIVTRVFSPYSSELGFEEVNVIPLTNNDIRDDLAEAGVFFEVTEQALVRLRYKMVLKQLVEDKAARRLQHAWQAHQARKAYKLFRTNLAARTLLKQGSANLQRLRQTLQQEREIRAELLLQQTAKEQAKQQLATAQNGLTQVTRKHQMTERELHVALDQVAQLMKTNAEMEDEMEELKADKGMDSMGMTSTLPAKLTLDSPLSSGNMDTPPLPDFRPASSPSLLSKGYVSKGSLSKGYVSKGSPSKGLLSKGSPIKVSLSKGSLSRGLLSKGFPNKSLLSKGSLFKGYARSPSKGLLSQGSLSWGLLSKGSLSKVSVDKGSPSKGGVSKGFVSQGSKGIRPRAVQGSSRAPYINRSTEAKAHKVLGKNSVAGALSPAMRASAALKRLGESNAVGRSERQLFTFIKPSAENVGLDRKTQAWFKANLQLWRGSPFRQHKRRPMSDMACNAMNNSPASRMGRPSTSADEQPEPSSDAQDVSPIDRDASRQKDRQGTVLQF